MSSVLQVKELTVEFNTSRGMIKAVDRVSFSLAPGEALGIVGESGSGKSVTSLAIMGLLPPQAVISGMGVEFSGENLLQLNERRLRALRGREMAMIFQDPMTSLNPCYTVGFQMSEALRAHFPLSTSAARTRSVELLAQVGIPDPQTRLQAFPYQLSGGMSQRVMIAMAIAGEPKLLIADEPTTALDVTIQAQILELLRRLQKERQMSLLLITHNIGVVSQYADRLMVMYAGQAVESGPISEVLENPSHPYTQGLLQALPEMHVETKFRQPLPSIPGLVPDLANRPSGCQMHPRCRYVDETCRQQEPAVLMLGQRAVKCLKPLSGGQM